MPDSPQPRRRASRGLWIALSAILLAGGGAFAYARHSPKDTPSEPVRDVPRLDGRWIRFSPEYAKRAKVEFARGEETTLAPVINVTGTTTFDPERVAAIGARIAGRVRRIHKFPGDAIAVGETIAEMESAELGQAQAAVLAARAHAEAAIANQKRETQLAEARISSQREAELAAATAAAAKAEQAAAEHKVRALGGTVTGEPGVLSLTSPIAGKMVELKVSRGQSVEPSFTMARVADLSKLWVELAVYEADLGRIREQDKVEISPQTNTKLVVNGTVEHVGDVIDLESRTAPVRIVVDNKDRTLRPGQSVIAKIHASALPRAVLLLPIDAVTSIDGKPTVFVAHDDTSVEPRTLTLGARDTTRVEIVSGLAPHERVAISGVFALKSETFR